MSAREWFLSTIPFVHHGRKRYHRGFTLIELLAVLAIMTTLAGIAIPLYLNALDKAKVAKAIADIRTLSSEIGSYQLFNGGAPLSLADVGRANFEDPYGNPYEYLNFATVKGKGKFRKDRFLVPINSDFDLYSKGKDGQSVTPLTAKASRDDIVRANDGGFIGLASEY
ncbi:MAG: type II secretion system protein [Candidatus Methylomirabilales bacterium]